MPTELRLPALDNGNLSAQPGPVLWFVLCCSVNLACRHVPIEQRSDRIIDSLVWYRQSYRKVCKRHSQGRANLAMLQSIAANYYEFLRGHPRVP